MAYKFQLGSGSLGGSVRAGPIEGTGSVTATTSFIIGSADLDETDLEKLDGITNGVGAANKCLVLDASADIASGLVSLTGSGDLKIANVHATAAMYSVGAVTAGSSFIIGAADLNEADMEKLDGITNGTVAASKAVVVDANKDISSFRRLTGVSLTASATLTVQGAQTTASANVSGALGLPLISDGGGLGAAGEIVAVSLANYASAIAGTGITATNGVLSVSTGGDNLTVTNVAVSGTLVAGLNYLATISSSVKVVLPGDASVGDVFYIKAGAGVDPTASPVADIQITGTVDPATIDGETSVTIESPFGAMGIIYAATDIWRII